MSNFIPSEYPSLYQSKYKNKTSTLVLGLVEASVRHFAVVVFLSSFTESPASSTKLKDLKQEQAAHGAQVLLQEKSIPQQIEQLIHELQVHLLQLISNTMQL